ncbi:MAG: Ig-like domain-containing protein [Treponema sp.]|nr:Ig-like domain-containing protein [Treponema sp.]
MFKKMLFAIAALVLIFGACEGSGNIVEEYTGEDEGLTYIMDITPVAGFHAVGDPYVFIVRGPNSERRSSGTVVGIYETGGMVVFILQPSFPGAPSFHVNTIELIIVFIHPSHTITFNDGSTMQGPGQFGAGSRGASSVGGGGGVSTPPSKANGAAVDIPTENTLLKTYRSITINAVTPPGNGQSVEYAISDSPSPPTSGWQSSLVFTELDGSDLTAGETYYIFARSAENSAFTAGPPSAPLTVMTDTTVLLPPYLIILDGDIALDPGGETRELTTLMNPTGTVTWISSSSFVATVDASGLVTSVNPGTAVITATSGSQTDTITVTVNRSKFWHSDVSSGGWIHTANGGVVSSTSYPGGFSGLELSGRGLSTTADQVFTFAYVPVTGDFTMIVRFHGPGAGIHAVRWGIFSGYSAVAGLIAIPQNSMSRDPASGSLTRIDDRRNLLYASTLAHRADTHFELRARTSRGAASLTRIPFTATDSDTEKDAAHVWIKLRRQGDNFFAGRVRGSGATPSTWDGTDSWYSEMPSVTIPMDNTVYVGLWVAAGENATLNPPSGPSPGPENTGRTIANFTDWRLVYGTGNASDAELRRAEAAIDL